MFKGLFKSRSRVKDNKEGYIKLTESMRSLYRVDVSKWRRAHQSAISPIRPRLDVLMDVYEDATLDTHLSAKLQSRTEDVLNTPFRIVKTDSAATTLMDFYENAVEKVNDELVKIISTKDFDPFKSEVFEMLMFRRKLILKALNNLNTQRVDKRLTKAFNKKWMYDCIRLVQETAYYGYSGLEWVFTNEGLVKSVKSVDRRHFVPQRNMLLPDPMMEIGVDITEKPYSNVYSLINYHSLGLLLECSKYTIFKKHATAHWQQLQQLFGIPMRIGRTPSSDQNTIDKIFESLKNMGSAGFGVLPESTQIEIIESAKNDPFKIFQEAINTCNKELSMRVLGYVDGDNKGGSFAREKVNFDRSTNITKADLRRNEFVFNEQIVPLLNLWGYELDGCEFEFEKNWELPVAVNQLEIDKWIGEKYDIDSDYLEQKYGVTINKSVKDEAEEAEKDLEPQKEEEEEEEVNNLFGVWNSLISQIDILTGLSNAADFDDKLVGLDITLPRFVEQMVKDIYDENIRTGSIVTDGYMKTGDELWQAVKSGADFDLAANRDKNWLAMQRGNVYAFSGAKTFAEMRAMNDLLFKDGRKRPFTEFRADVLKVYSNYNEHWLKTEYDTAQRGALMGKKWLDIQRDKDIYPYLRYRTQGDARVRKEHQSLEGIVLPVEHPMWNKIYPPNGWNCRCPVPEQLRGDQLDASELESANSAEYAKYVNDLFDDEVPNTFFHKNVGRDAILNAKDTEYIKAMPVLPNDLEAVRHYNMKAVDDLTAVDGLPTLGSDDLSLSEWFKLSSSERGGNDAFFDLDVDFMTVRVDVAGLADVSEDVSKWLTVEFENVLLSPSEVFTRTIAGMETIDFVKYYKGKAVSIYIEKIGEFWYFGGVREADAVGRMGVLLHR